MKKIILAPFFIFLVFGFEIKHNKTFKIEYTPKNFIFNIKLIILKKDLNKLFNSISNIPKNNFCKINNYSVIPIFNKNNNFEIYKSYVNINCNINNKKTNNLDKFLRNISTLGKVNITSIYPQRKNLNNELKLKAYIYGEHFSKDLSKKLNLNCFIKSITFNTITPIYSNKYKTLSITIPNNSKKENLNAFYLIECIK